MIGTARSSFSSIRRRARLPWPSGDPFRILSIDGGGIKGIFPAAVLADLETRFLGGSSIASYFDLITGTSTGGILALGLAAGKTSRELLEIYQKDGQAIFPPGRLGRLWRWARGWSLYQYDRTSLTDVLERTLGSRTLAESKSRLCIPAFEGHHGEVYIFKTPHHPDYRLDGKESMVTIGQATAAAPCYFKALDWNGYRFVDGGVWANNPIMIGLVDALACFELESTQIHILSIGCGRDQVRVGWAKAVGGKFSWATAVFAAMELQSQNVLGQARLLAGPEQVVRIEPRIGKAIALDDWKRSSAELPTEAAEIMKAFADDVGDAFLSHQARPPRLFWPPMEPPA